MPTYFEQQLNEALSDQLLDEGAIDNLFGWVSGKSPEEVARLKQEKQAAKHKKQEMIELKWIDQANNVKKVMALLKKGWITTPKGEEAAKFKIQDLYYRAGKEPPRQFSPGVSGMSTAQHVAGRTGTWGDKDPKTGELVYTRDDIQRTAAAIQS